MKLIGFDVDLFNIPDRQFGAVRITRNCDFNYGHIKDHEYQFIIIQLMTEMERMAKLIPAEPVANTTDEFFGYKDLQDYLNHLYDILYINHDDATVVRHMQETGADRIDAIKRARAQLGDEPYIISCTKHAHDVNPLDKE